MGLLLDAIYGMGLLASSPIWLSRMMLHGRYREAWAQRLGKVPLHHGRQPVIWIHGVSLGEINATRTLVAELNRQLPDHKIVISSTTETGMAAARRLYAPSLTTFHWPLDFTWAVGRAMSRVRPSLVVLMEGEAWPNFLAACNKRGIPAVVVNGRMSPNKGYPRYKKLGPLAAWLFNRLTAIGVQDEIYAEKFIDLGTKPEKVRVTGMMKYDAITVADSLEGQAELAAALAIDETNPLWVAGGTGPGEEAILLDEFAKLQADFPALQLAIVPRKPERFDEVARLIEERGFTCVRRSQHPDDKPATAAANSVILGDTMGELKKFYALADIVFVGRSLIPMGGSDMIEAAAMGKAVCFGPHTFNFPQAKDMLDHGCVEVADGPAMTKQIRVWLNNPAAAESTGHAAQQFVASRQGATRRNVDLICELLGRRPAMSNSDTATEVLK